MSLATRTPLPAVSSAPARVVQAHQATGGGISAWHPLETIALAPASALCLKPAWQAVAKRLPAGSVLIVTTNTWSRERVANIIQAFQAHRHTVTTIAAEQLTERQARLF